MPDSKTNTGVASESFLLVVANNEGVVCQLGSAFGIYLYGICKYTTVQITNSTILQLFTVSAASLYCEVGLGMADLTGRTR